MRLFGTMMSVSVVSVSLIIPFFLFPHVNKSSVDLTDSSEDTPEDRIVRQVNLVNSMWSPNSKNVHTLASHHL